MIVSIPVALVPKTKPVESLSAVTSKTSLEPVPPFSVSFAVIEAAAALKVIAAESWNFGKIIRDSFNTNATVAEKGEAEKLQKYFYEYFVTRIGAAPFRGYGGSIKKGSTDTGNDGMAYRVYGCGIKSGSDRMIISLESIVVLPK